MTKDEKLLCIQQLFLQTFEMMSVNRRFSFFFQILMVQ